MNNKLEWTQQQKHEVRRPLTREFNCIDYWNLQLLSSITAVPSEEDPLYSPVYHYRFAFSALKMMPWCLLKWHYYCMEKKPLDDAKHLSTYWALQVKHCDTDFRSRLDLSAAEMRPRNTWCLLFFKTVCLKLATTLALRCAPLQPAKTCWRIATSSVIDMTLITTCPVR